MKDEHPSQEQLAEFAVENTDQTIARHLEACPSCARYMKELHAVAQALHGLPDEDIPDQVWKNVNAVLHKKKFLWLSVSDISVTNWHKNPLLICLALIALILFLYVFIVFLL
jgi:hypothetical protein